MAWERNFERRAIGIRETELKYQKQSYVVQVIFSWNEAYILLIGFFRLTDLIQCNLE